MEKILKMSESFLNRVDMLSNPENDVYDIVSPDEPIYQPKTVFLVLAKKENEEIEIEKLHVSNKKELEAWLKWNLRNLKRYANNGYKIEIKEVS